MRNDMTWVRPLDPARLLESRRGGAPGHIVLEVADPDGYANGRFEWTASPEGSQCRPSTASADLALSAAMLGAASLGGTSLLTLARAGLIEELAPGAVDRAGAMLAWAAPSGPASGFRPGGNPGFPSGPSFPGHALAKQFWQELLPIVQRLVFVADARRPVQVDEPRRHQELAVG
jgi:Sterol carrier protein domain